MKIKGDYVEINTELFRSDIYDLRNRLGKNWSIEKISAEIGGLGKSTLSGYFNTGRIPKPILERFCTFLNKKPEIYIISEEAVTTKETIVSPIELPTKKPTTPPTSDYDSLVDGLNEMYLTIKEVVDALNKNNDELEKIRKLLTDSFVLEKERSENVRNLSENVMNMSRPLNETAKKTKSIFEQMKYYRPEF